MLRKWQVVIPFHYKNDNNKWDIFIYISLEWMPLKSCIVGESVISSVAKSKPSYSWPIVFAVIYLLLRTWVRFELEEGFFHMKNWAA